MRALYLVPLGLLALVGLDLAYFDHIQKAANGGAISEGFIRKGGLGKLLRDGGYLGISPDSGKAVSDNLCAPDEVPLAITDTLIAKSSVNASPLCRVRNPMPYILMPQRAHR